MAAPRKHPPKNAAEIIQKLAAEGNAIIGIGKHFGVAPSTFKRWLDEDEVLQDAFDAGREAERLFLHSLIVQAAVANKGANSNAMFLLKARHGYREGDQQNITVAVETKSVLYVKDHGDDATWALKAAEQQRKLTLDCQIPMKVPSQLVAPLPAIPAKAPELPPWAIMDAEPVQAAPAPPEPHNAPSWSSGA